MEMPGLRACLSRTLELKLIDVVIIVSDVAAVVVMKVIV